MTWYFIRLTTDNTNKQSLAEMLGAPYLISKEYSRRMKLHYHIVHQASINKDQLKNKFYELFPEEPRGVQTLKVDTIGDTLEDWEQASTYTVKDGNFIYSSEFEEKIQDFVANSYKKPETYSVQLKELIESTTDSEYYRIDWNKLKIDIAILKAQFHLEVYKSRIEALVLSIQISMNNNVASELFSCE